LSSQIQIAALYKFVPLDDFESLKPSLLALCKQEGVKGTLLLAAEGINGTIAGSEVGVGVVLNHLRADPRLSDLSHKTSWAKKIPFNRMKVRLKKEIVTLGVPSVDPLSEVGTYVSSQEWNELITDPDVVVIDTRNTYETAIGTFVGARDPKTSNFREFADWIDRSDISKDTKVAMFCTGGIRCEKATSLLLERGFKEVFHLEGGILKYLENIPVSESLWRGECFVFDHRVSVNHDLEPGTHAVCYACGRPVSSENQTAAQYVKGVSCPSCYWETTPEQKMRFAQRQEQITRCEMERSLP